MTIKIGWIGCGRHATWMLMPQLARSGFEITAVCDRDDEAARNAALQFGAKSVYSDYDDMITNADIDAVGMAVGPEIHFRATLAAIKCGIPVFLEKPPAATAAARSAPSRPSAAPSSPAGPPRSSTRPAGSPSAACASCSS